MWFKSLLVILIINFIKLNFSSEVIEAREDDYCGAESHNKTCCHSSEFQCANGHCIPRERMCDSDFNGTMTQWRARLNVHIAEKLDCADASDEVGCVSTSCEARPVPCPQGCIDAPGNKSRCQCFKGYTLKTTLHNQTCVDINECAIGVHMCSHDCVNLNGTFRCTCKEGYELTNGTHSGVCRAVDDNVQIFYNSDKKLYSLDVNSGKRKLLIGEDQSNLQELSYDIANDIVYWLDNHELKRSYIVGSRNGTVSVGHAQNVAEGIHWSILWNNSLAVDWTAGNLYWFSSNILNTSVSQILVSKLDGRYMKTLLDEIYEGRDLVLDPEYGKMYWISGGDSAELGAAWMNGMFRRTVIKLRGQNPVGLALDHMSNSKLFWVDSISNKVFAVNADGTRISQVRHIGDHRPLAMDVFENYLYLLTSDRLVKLDKYGRGEIYVLDGALTNQTSVKVYHKRKVDVQIRKAALYCRSQCSHLCIHIPRGYSCTCPDGSKIVSLMGELICDEPEQTPLPDPVVCDCARCNTTCDCSKYCSQSTGDVDPTSEREIPYIQISISIFIILAIISGFVLSFYKKQISSSGGNSDGFNNPILSNSETN